jgi:amino acid adenylation domain-containing protein
VSQYPRQIAVKTRDQVITYTALNRAANRLARAILAQRGEGEEPIVMLLEHGASAIVSILGILKAGKTYVPLDPSHPPDRINYILEDTKPGLIVTNDKNLSLASSFEAIQSMRRVFVLNMDKINTSLSNDNLGLTISPDTNAHIFYTSGSTGQPKGVPHDHRNVLHGIRIYTNDLYICASDRISLLVSCSFAGSRAEIFGALLNGATLCLYDIKEEGLDHLARWLIQEEISILAILPTLFGHFLNNLTREEKFPKLRFIVLGSESVTMRDVELYHRHASKECVLVNRLAMTETAGIITRFFIDQQTAITGSIVPVGYPVEGTKILLLDDAGEEVGFNRVGEIVVKSRYLCSAYWRRPDLTRAVFLPDPGGDERFYWTGDLGRMRPDGCLEYLGRKDSQVKIRGYKIEVAVIEAALHELDIIKDAVVMAQEDQSGDRRLIAYLVPSSQPAPTISALRSALAETFPDYMIPSAFVMLEKLPLTPIGKVDRNALSAPGRARPELGNPFVPPRTPLERALVDIWAQVLKLDNIGIHDKFLDLGGNSLQATQIISQVSDVFQVELPLRALFESPTVASMATVVAQHQAKLIEGKELEQMLTELEGLSDEEVQRLLSEEGR